MNEGSWYEGAIDPNDIESWKELAYMAWTVIANAGLHRGNWDHEDPEWVEAAKRWRDTYHRML